MANRIPLIVNSTANQIQELPTTDRLLIHAGTAKGLQFTSDPGGGTGDLASITYEVVTGEETKLKIAVANDASDVIELATANTAHTLVSANGDSSSKTTGAFRVNGGVGIVKKLFVGDDITAFASSDEKLKDNITPIPNALDKVISISGNTFTWNSESDYEGREDTGVIAQEIEKLGLPGVTETRENGTKAVRYERLVPLLIEAIKELDGKIKSLEG